MPYFRDHYSSLRFPMKSDDREGFNRAQLGALFATASHFTLHKTPAIVVMPTGSGKTAVLMAYCFLKPATRVLLLTPSRLVRAQVAEGFSKLQLLRKIEAIPDGVPDPAVKEVKNKLLDASDWERLRSFDVIVGTPNCVSPAQVGVAPPAADLFDLVLVDEAHHSSARTWREALNSFPNAERLLVTATPFRRDRKEIAGRFVYVYPLKEALKDRVFGRIRYVPVEPVQQSADQAVAVETERVYQEDKNNNLDHRIMIRTDGKKRAEELAKVYAEATQLRLETVHSDRSLRFANTVIERLRRGELDGIICVNMLGEGFDFANLKIAAIHSPHKSLAVTLQFIGRFARTNARDIGDATFLAVPSEIEIESQKLYNEGAAWDELVTNLSQSRIAAEVENREVIQGFELDEAASDPEDDVSLHSLRPFAHVKIYKVFGDVNLAEPLALPDNYEVLHRWFNPDLPAVSSIFAEIKKPKWSTTDQFAGTSYHLLVAYYDEDTAHLFLNCSSTKSLDVYSAAINAFTAGNHRMLTVGEVDKVLSGLDELDLFNIGLRNRVQGSSSESYLIRTGPAAQQAVSESDGRIYHRGHIFGKSVDGTIGYSSSSKVWSSQRLLIPQLVKWAKKVSERLVSAVPVLTRSNLDHISCGRHVEEFPQRPVGMIWNPHTFKSPPLVKTPLQVDAFPLVDADLVLDTFTSKEIVFGIQFAGARLQLCYRLDRGFTVTAVDENEHQRWEIERAVGGMSIADYFK